MWLANNGISAGWNNPDGSKAFQPMAEVTRQDYAAFLCRLAGSPAIGTTTPIVLHHILNGANASSTGSIDYRYERKTSGVCHDDHEFRFHGATARMGTNRRR